MTDESFPGSGALLAEYDVRRFHFFWAITVPIMILAFVVAIAVFLIRAVGSIGPAMPILLFPIFIVTVLFLSWRREAYWLALSTDGQLLWKAILRVGRVPVRDVRSIHSSYPPWLNIVTIESTGEDRGIRISVLRGFREFATALHSQNPEIHLRLDWGARMAERGPWRARVRRADRS